MNPDSQLAKLDDPMPPTPKAIGVYRPAVVVDSTVYLSGHLPLRADGSLITGRVGEDLRVEDGYQAARRVGLAMLATLQATLGELRRVRQVVKLTGFVNASADFTQHASVINGCSELFDEIFGPQVGVSARSAVGVGSLPQGAVVEIEGIFAVVTADS